jgi:hypothetical protein
MITRTLLDFQWWGTVSVCLDSGPWIRAFLNAWVRGYPESLTHPAPGGRRLITRNLRTALSVRAWSGGHGGPLIRLPSVSYTWARGDPSGIRGGRLPS